ncbi:MAG TPA: DEAD/DEAH box helicase, partial [Myxococcaceae bacterium]|nr:DEAD/DEAH box helicase [Myxococcaceae bacterium]
MDTAPTDSDAASGFKALGLQEPLLQALAKLGYEEPTPIQREAVPLLLQGRDVLGQAATGTGKTAAFALPLLQRLTPGACGPFEAAALVLVPTRELAMQVAEAVHTYGKDLGVSVLPVYGGQDMGQQLRRLKRGTDVVVATPGRALDHLRRKTLKLERVNTVVLDEADEMLDMGFAEDLEAILSALPDTRQTALFSATLPPRIAAIAERHLRNPARVNIRREKPVPGSAPKVRQVAYTVTRAQKAAALGRVLDLEMPKSAIVFCRTRTEVDALSDTLKASGVRAEALHGGMSQEQRDRVMKRFKSGTSELLVATDVAARGLHVEKLSHVVNYDLPTAPEVYVHRIGRTGRAGEEGVAISFAEPREHRLLRNIERMTGQKITAASLPTVADLRARKLGLTAASLREILVSGMLDGFRGVVENLAQEYDPLDVAAAAVKLAVGDGDGEREELKAPEPRSAPERREAPARPERSARSQKPVRPERAAERSGERETASPPPRSRDPERRPAGGEFVKLFIGAGRKAGMRPADLVGAIANESRLSGRQIGAIEIADRFSLVEVPAD